MNSSDRFSVRCIQQSQKAAAVFLSFLGLLVLSGWAVMIPRLHTPLPRLGTMQPLTAFALLSAGISLYMWREPMTKHRIRAARIFAGAVAVTAVVSIGNHIAYRIGVNMEAMVRGGWFGVILAPEKQMALSTAVSISFAGCSLYLIDNQTSQEGRPGSWLPLASGLLPFTVLIGYIYGIDGLKAPLPSAVASSKMALSTSIALLVLAFAILTARPRSGWMTRFTSDTSAGVMMRRLLPAAVTILLGLGLMTETCRTLGLYGHRIGAAIVTALSIALFGVLIDRCTRELLAMESSRLRTEADLKKSEERLRMALEAARIGTWEWDLASDRIWWSESIYDLFRIPRGSFDGQFESFLQLVHPDDRQMVQARVRRFLERAEDSYAVEFRSIVPDGSFRHMAGRGNLVFDSNGAVTSFAGTMMDVTDRKLLERELIEASNREQRRLGQDLHDDLGQWLTAIHLEARALSMSLKPISEPGAARAEKIVSWMGEALERTRMLARGMTPAVIETGGLSAALQELSVNTERMLHARCHYSYDDALVVRSSEAALQLYRIAQEAISNALRHGNASEIVLSLEQQKNGSACLRIQDNGNGIPHPLPKSSGLGLRTMRYRAELLGADIEIRALREGGTEVICRFNVEPPPEITAAECDSFACTSSAKY